ncbi:hypothetical protein Tco_1418487 [Tanacetum coccineum]
MWWLPPKRTLRRFLSKPNAPFCGAKKTTRTLGGLSWGDDGVGGCMVAVAGERGGDGVRWWCCDNGDDDGDKGGAERRLWWRRGSVVTMGMVMGIRVARSADCGGGVSGAARGGWRGDDVGC